MTIRQDSSVGVASLYRLDGPGIESRLGAKFSPPVQTGPVANPASYTMGTGSFLGVKRPGAWHWPPTPSNAEVKGRVELYLYFNYGSSWPVRGRTLHGNSLATCSTYFVVSGIISHKILSATRDSKLLPIQFPRNFNPCILFFFWETSFCFSYFVNFAVNKDK